MAVKNESEYKTAFVTAWHHFTYFLIYIPLRTLFRFRVNAPQNIGACQLIVTNHKSLFDSWFFGCTLPYSKFSTIAPIRFLASQSFRHPVLNAIYSLIIYPFIYWPNGVILMPPRRTNDGLTIEDKTREIIDALNLGKTVLLYAEGRVYKKEGVGKFKRGPAYIQKKTGVPILLASIRFSRRGNLPGSQWWVPWAKREINWAQEFTYIPKEIIDDSEKASEWLRSKVVELYES